MLHEHSLGRGFVKGLSEAVEKAKKNEAVKSALSIANSYKSTSSKKTIFFIRWPTRHSKERAQKEIAEKIRQNSGIEV